jgi:hypothetical protein
MTTDEAKVFYCQSYWSEAFEGQLGELTIKNVAHVIGSTIEEVNEIFNVLAEAKTEVEADIEAPAVIDEKPELIEVEVKGSEVVKVGYVATEKTAPHVAQIKILTNHRDRVHFLKSVWSDGFQEQLGEINKNKLSKIIGCSFANVSMYFDEKDGVKNTRSRNTQVSYTVTPPNKLDILKNKVADYDKKVELLKSLQAEIEAMKLDIETSTAELKAELEGIFTAVTTTEEEEAQEEAPATV